MEQCIKTLRKIPVVIAVGIIPLIIRISVHTNEELAGYTWLPQGFDRYADIFFACKAYTIEVLMALMVLLLLYNVFVKKEKLPKDRVLVLLLVYFFFVLLSGLMSAHLPLAFKGSFERFEPVGVIAGYLVIFYYSRSCVKSEDDLKFIVRISAIFIGIMLVLGILQGAGFDPFNLLVVKKLITPASLHDRLDNLQMMRDKGVAYLTLYNEDYLGMYFGLLIPVCVSLVFGASSKIGKAAAGVFTLVCMYVLWHGRSLGGWVSLAFTGIIAAMIVSNRSKKGAAVSWICLGVLAAILIVSLKWFPFVRDRVNRELSSSSSRVRKVTGLETGDYGVVFRFFDGNELHCSFDFEDNDRLHVRFTDKDGNELIYHDDGEAMTLEERFMYADATVTPWQMDDIKAAMFTIDDHQWPLVHGEDGTYYYLDSYMNLVKVKMDYSVGIFDDGFLSGRGAIWNRTLPILKRHIFKGLGANTFVTEYPQDDQVYLNYTYGWGYSEMNVKAHSLYLGNMIENGLIGTLCLMAFFVIYIIKGIQVYSRPVDGGKEGPFVYYLGFGLFLGCVAYLISGIVNDSNVCTAPVFWAFMGISVNNILLFHDSEAKRLS